MEIAPGPAMTGIPSGTTAGSNRESSSLGTSLTPFCIARMDMIVKRMPPPIWKAGTVIPKKEKIAPPATAKKTRMAVAAIHARQATRRRSSGVPAVRATKIGAAEIGLMTAKREENASSAKRAASEFSIPPSYPGT